MIWFTTISLNIPTTNIATQAPLPNFSVVRVTLYDSLSISCSHVDFLVSQLLDELSDLVVLTPVDLYLFEVEYTRFGDQ